MSITPSELRATRNAVRAQAPLVHNLTSAVVANFTANALLALGASPAMVEAAEEVEAFAALAGALVINLGSLTTARAAVMRLAVHAANAAGTPWVLDPVAAGAIAHRTAFAIELCQLRPAAIRGNASEILGLAGEAGHGRGVDSTSRPEAAIAAAQRLALSTGAIIAVTGAVDYVTEGSEIITLTHGHPMMARVTGMGCAASALVAACLAVEPNRLRATAHAVALNGLAGERAATHAAGPGSLMIAYLDQLASDDLV